MHACIHTCMHAYIHTYIHTSEPPQKNPAILNMYWTDLGLWTLIEHAKNTR